MQLLENQVVFLSGGSMGIGLECAKAYAKAGASVVIAASSGDPEAIALQLGSQHLGILCDVSDEVQVAKAIGVALRKYGKINAVHNNAGIASPSKPLHETSDEEWTRLLDVNLKSVLYTTRYAFEALKQSKGCILNTSSLVGEIGQENHAAYSATKGGMNALTKSMALDYAKYQIRVNAVSPAGVWTPLLREWNQEQPDPQSMQKYLDDIHPLGYCPEGDVVADACVFLISEKARFITGHIMPVSGGAELGYRVINQ